jgi:hypothetical protein
MLLCCSAGQLFPPTHPLVLMLLALMFLYV